jgi:hypothetical protein
MVVVGVDAHKRTHTLVAVDSNGREVGRVTVRASSAGHLEAVKWVASSMRTGCGRSRIAAT